MDSIAKLLGWLYQSTTSNEPLSVDKPYLNCIKQCEIVAKYSVNYYYYYCFYSSKEIGFKKVSQQINKSTVIRLLALINNKMLT